MYIDLLTFLSVVAATLFVTTGLICAAVRWWHVCKPYSDNPDYYFPSRKYMTMAYASVVQFLPLILFPGSPDAWLSARMLAILSAPAYVIMTQYRFFAHSHSVRASLMRVYFILIGAFGFALAALGCCHGILSEHSTAFYAVAGMASLLGICQYVWSVLYFFRMIREYHLENYANEDAFPLRKMRLAMLLPGFEILLVLLLSMSRVGMVIYFPLGAILHVTVLILFLHPHKQLMTAGQMADQYDFEDFFLDVQKEEERADEMPAADNRLDDVYDRVLAVLKDKQLYLDPDLDMTKLVQEVCVSRTYISNALQRAGGFYKLVNRLRLQYVNQYMQDHPEASVEDASIAAGFGSSRTYYRLKSKL